MPMKHWDIIGAQCTPLSSLHGTKTDDHFDHLIHHYQSHRKYQTLIQDSTPSPGSFAGLAFSVFASAQLRSALGARSACGWSILTELRISSSPHSTQHGAKDYIQHQGAFSHLILGAALRGRQLIPLFREEETESQRGPTTLLRSYTWLPAVRIRNEVSLTPKFFMPLRKQTFLWANWGWLISSLLSSLASPQPSKTKTSPKQIISKMKIPKRLGGPRALSKQPLSKGKLYVLRGKGHGDSHAP